MADLPGCHGKSDSQCGPQFRFIVVPSCIMITLMIYSPSDLATAIDSCGCFFAKHEPSVARKFCQAICAGKTDTAATTTKCVWSIFTPHARQLLEDLASGKYQPQDPEQSEILRFLNHRLGGPVFPAASFGPTAPADLGIDVRALAPQVQHLLDGQDQGSHAERRMINRAFIEVALGDSSPDEPGIHPLILWSVVVLLLANIFRMFHAFLVSCCRGPRPGEVRNWYFTPAGRLGLFLLQSLVILAPWHCLGVIREGAFLKAADLFSWLGYMFCAFLLWDIAALAVSKKAPASAPAPSWLRRRLRSNASFRQFALVWLASDGAAALLCLLMAAGCEGWLVFWGRTVQEGPFLIRTPLNWALALFAAMSLLIFAADYGYNRAFYFPPAGGKADRSELQA